MRSEVLPKLKEGDIIFTSIPAVLYQSVERATNSPTSHVGIVLRKGDRWVVAESRIPFSCYSPLDEFINRSKDGWFSVKRLEDGISNEQLIALKAFCEASMGKLYHLGFNYHSRRMFCSKFVHDAFKVAVGVDVGRLVTFEELLNENPGTSKLFWSLYYFGFIPWNRYTVTPGSQYDDSKLLHVA